MSEEKLISTPSHTDLVLDTSAILSNPTFFLSCASDVHVCLTVLEELDGLKEHTKKAAGVEARAAIRVLEDIVKGKSSDEIKQGIQIPSTPTMDCGKLYFGFDTSLPLEKELDELAGNPADNRIINYALHLQRNGKKVKLLSRDINMLLKAKALGVDAENPSEDKTLTDIDMLYSGVHQFQENLFDLSLGDENFELKGKTYRFSRSTFPKECQERMYWYDEADNIGKITAVDENFVYTELLKRDIDMWGLKPKNPRQAIAFEQLTSDDYDLSVILGPAGGGKTLLAMAAALSARLDHKKFKQIVVLRARTFTEDEPGYLPGSLHEKTLPLMGGVTDALISLHSTGERAKDMVTLEHVMEKACISFASLAYIKGHSFEDTLVILDELQDCNKTQLKAVLSRASKNCRVFALGNINQISGDVTPLTSAATIAATVYKDFERASILVLDQVERSALAEFTEQKL